MTTSLDQGQIRTDQSFFGIVLSNVSIRALVDSVGNIFYGGKTAGGFTQDGGVLSGFNTSTGGTITIVRGTGGTMMVFGNSNQNAAVGSITISAGSTAYNTVSDYRLKENVAPMTGALEKVLQLNPVTYTWKADGSAGQGFIAHELQAICPDAVTGVKDGTKIESVVISEPVEPTFDENGKELTPFIEATYEEQVVPDHQGVDASFLVATLTAAIQELAAKNDALEARIAALE